jgi:hypothetical protein
MRRVLKTIDPERLRRALPLEQYIFILHQAATTGFVPVLNEYGRAVAPDRLTDAQKMNCFLDGKERVKVLSYLVDKRMPTLQTVAMNVQQGQDVLASAPGEARYLSSADLARSAAAEEEIVDAEFAPSVNEMFGVAAEKEDQ